MSLVIKEALLAAFNATWDEYAAKPVDSVLMQAILLAIAAGVAALAWFLGTQLWHLLVMGWHWFLFLGMVILVYQRLAQRLPATLSDAQELMRQRGSPFLPLAPPPVYPQLDSAPANVIRFDEEEEEEKPPVLIDRRRRL
jgi:hypothetical protein